VSEERDHEAAELLIRIAAGEETAEDRRRLEQDPELAAELERLGELQVLLETCARRETEISREAEGDVGEEDRERVAGILAGAEARGEIASRGPRGSGAWRRGRWLVLAAAVVTLLLWIGNEAFDPGDEPRPSGFLGVEDEVSPSGPVDAVEVFELRRTLSPLESVKFIVYDDAGEVILESGERFEARWVLTPPEIEALEVHGSFRWRYVVLEEGESDTSAAVSVELRRR